MTYLPRESTCTAELPSRPCSEVNDKTYPPLVYGIENQEGHREEIHIPQQIYMV